MSQVITLNWNRLQNEKQYARQRSNTDIIPDEITHDNCLNRQNPNVMQEHAQVFEFIDVV